MNRTSAVSTRSLSRPIVLAAAVAGITIIAAASLAQEKAKPVTPAKAPAAPSPAASAPKYRTNVKGPADAPIKVVEFADFMCPGCREMSVALRGYFAQQGPDISLTFKNFPLEQSCNPGIGRTVHNGACELALGSICAAELGAFWPYHDRIFSRAWEVATRQDVLDNGVAVGIDKAKLEACLGSADAKSKLAIQVKEAFETMVRVTPTLVVNGKRLEANNLFANVVDEERKKLAAAKAK